jgi:hypothetical protein
MGGSLNGSKLSAQEKPRITKYCLTQAGAFDKDNIMIVNFIG